MRFRLEASAGPAAAAEEAEAEAEAGTRTRARAGSETKAAPAATGAHILAEALRLNREKAAEQKAEREPKLVHFTNNSY